MSLEAIKERHAAAAAGKRIITPGGVTAGGKRVMNLDTTIQTASNERRIVDASIATDPTERAFYANAHDDVGFLLAELERLDPVTYHQKELADPAGQVTRDEFVEDVETLADAQPAEDDTVEGEDPFELSDRPKRRKRR